jgi:hypothetical protein
MQNLFEIEGSKHSKKLNVLINNESPTQTNFNTLFRPIDYDTIHIATFVSSPKFFFDSIKEYKKAILILGIEDSENVSKFILDPVAKSEFFQKLDTQTLEKISKGDIEIRYTPAGTTIHSKIYIQKSMDSSFVLVGSANFSQNAFRGTNQYEELIGYTDEHNPSFVNHFQKRFQELYENSLDYVPERIKKKIKDSPEQVFLINEEDTIDFIKETVSQIGSMAFSDEIEHLNQSLESQNNHLKQELQSVVQSKKIFEIVTKKSGGQLQFISSKELEKKRETLITKVFKIEKEKKEYEDTRAKMFYSTSLQTLVLQDNVSKALIPFPKKHEASLIKSKIQLLGEFISAYSKYTYRKDSLITPKRIFESILYAFTSPYIWKIRDEYSKIGNSNEVRIAVPLFLLIAGQAQSGKTHLLQCISSITNSNSRFFHYKSAAKLSSLEQINPQIIDTFLNEENVTTVLIDEIDKDYFNSNNSSKSGYMGESYIKNMTNSKEGIFPCVLATSNTDFSAHPQTMRRIYYIQLNDPFESSSDEMREHFSATTSSFGMELYQDFLFRLEEKFSQGIKLKLDDFLYLGREIFKDYFAEYKINTPDWFSNTPINDYYLRGKEIWHAKYMQNRKAFKEVVSKNEIILDEEKIFGTKLTASKDKRELIQFLKIGVLKEDKGITKLNRKEFFEFIGLESTIKRYFSSMFS